MTIEPLLARYRSLIDDPQAFERYCAKPLPTCIWTNPIKTSPGALVSYLQAEGIELEALSWLEGAFRSDRWDKPGQTLGFVTGWYQVQEEISLTAVEVLAPQPGERVLDLCAAPGGKSGQIAMRLGKTGMVVANEKQVSRLTSLRTTLYRLGVLNAVITNCDGRRLPLLPHSFDRVLVDAPCTGEGTGRKYRSAGRIWRPQFRDRVTAIQRQLLDRALQLVKPTGVVVYSTCTFAPEENEAVIDAVLGDRGELETAEIPGLRGMSGLRQWQGRHFRADLVRACRFFPHFNDTGGFFVARIRRNAQALSPTPVSNSSPTPAVPLDLSHPPLADYSDRFGIDAAILEQFRFWQKGKRKIWMADVGVKPLQRLEMQTIGLPVLRKSNTGFKPTTFGLQRLGRYITRNIVTLESVSQLERFLAGGSQLIAANVTPGYVHVRFGAFELGCGFYRNGILASQLPKVLRLSRGNRESST